MGLKPTISDTRINVKFYADDLGGDLRGDLSGDLNWDLSGDLRGDLRGDLSKNQRGDSWKDLRDSTNTCISVHVGKFSIVESNISILENIIKDLKYT